MIPNIAITIEEVDNGYVVRPLSRADKATLPSNTIVATTLDDLAEFVVAHFKSRVCPICNQKALRSEHMLLCASVYRCPKCYRVTVDDADEWIESPIEYTDKANTAFYAKLSDLATAARLRNA